MNKLYFKKTNQDFINFIISAPAFSIAAAGLAYILYIKNGKLPMPNDISPFDVLILVFASFRLTRLFVYDKVMDFFRDLFTDIKNIEVLEEDIKIHKKNFPYGIRRTVHDLLYCSWCTNVWMSLFVIFFYYFSIISWFFIFMLAISGAATIIQIITNKIEFS